MNQRISVLCFLILAVSFIGCESNITTVFSTPESFSTDAYCNQRSIGEAPDIPKSILDALDENNKTVSEAAIAKALLTKAAIEVAHESVSIEDCRNIFSRGEALFLSILKGQQQALGQLGGFKPAKDPAILLIQAEITRHWREDQSARGAYLGLRTDDKSGANFWAQRLATAHATLVDSNSRDYINTLLEEYDWIDKKRFGKTVSDHAWLVVQHADDHPEFQTLVLTRMKPYLETNSIKPSNYAYLWDRVAVNTGKKQRYGTQPIWECENGKLKLQPLEDPDNVNQRRARMKMDTVEKGLEKMAMSVCG